MDLRLATEQPREEPSGGGRLLVALALLATRDVLHDLVHMLAAARPCCFPTDSARNGSAHLVFPFDWMHYTTNYTPGGILECKEA